LLFLTVCQTTFSDARWFTREEVLEILGTGAALKPKELKKMGEGVDNVLAPAVNHPAALQISRGDINQQTKPRARSRSTSRSRERSLERARVPSQTAIGGVLIHKFAHRQLEALGYNFKGKANL